MTDHPRATGAKSLYVQDARTRRRNAAEKRFRAYGLTAIVIACTMLAVLVFTIVSTIIGLVVFALTQGSNAPDGWSTPYVYVTLTIGGIFLCAAVYVQGWVSEQPLLPAEIFQPKYIKRLFLALFCAYGVFGLYLFYASF